MPQHIQVQIEARWAEEIPQDVETCAVCGEAIFFKLWRLLVSVGNCPWQKSDVAVCDSCYDHGPDTMEVNGG